MKPSKILKESVGSFSATAVRIICAFVSNKVLSYFLGPVGFACVGQLQNILSIGQGTSSLSLQNGWVSLTARYKNNADKLNSIWRGGFRLSVFASLITAISLMIFCFFAPLSSIFPKIPERLVQSAILFSIPGVISLSVISICSSVMNGLSDYKRWALITTLSSILQCLWVVFFVLTGSLSVLSIVATQSILSSVFAIVIAKRGGFTYSRFKKGIKENFSPWGSYAAMGIAPMILTPLICSLTRSFLGSSFGWDAAGLWQGAMKISDFFNVGFSSVLGVVLLPRLSSSSSERFHSTLKALLWRVLLIAFVSVIVLFAFRNFIIVFCLSDKFLSLSSLLPIQFIGDFFRSGCWCLGLALIARKETVAFLAVEIGADVLFALFTFASASLLGYEAPFYAYIVENVFCFIALLIVVRRIPWKNL